MLSLLVANVVYLLPSRPVRASGSSLRGLRMDAADDERQLVQLAALTDRGQRGSPGDKSQFNALVQTLEAAAPPADAQLMNGEWRLLYSTETPYQSSPFFWAFRQATSMATTPIAIPSGGVLPGDSLADAVYAITDAIPFYDIGSARVVIEGVCDEMTGCPVPDEFDSTSDGASDGDEPSDGTSDPSAKRGGGSATGSLESRVELTTRLFGLPVASSIMTTTATVEGTDPAFASDTGASTLDLELTIGTTTAAQSTLAQSIPQAAGLLGPFPSGDALEMASKGSSKVMLRTTYLTESMRISRPILADGVADPRSVFVYTKEDL